MKSRKPLLLSLAAGSLLFTGSLLAQNQPMPPTPPPPPPAQATPMPPLPPPAPASTSAPAAPAAEQAGYQTPQGELTVRSVPAPAPQIGPAPAFSQLSGGGKGITEQQAAAYPPLANDFIHADSNRNGSISQSEYERWTKQL